MNKNKKMLFLALTLVTVLILVSAVNATNDTDKSVDNTISEKTSTHTNNIIKETTTKESVTKTQKTINKENKTEKQRKKEPQTITLNSTNFEEYVSYGMFNEKVSAGDTIDVDGMLDSDKFSLTVNKPLNFISSKNNSYINLYAQSTGDYGVAIGGQLTFNHGASGSNVTNLYFYNTRIKFTNVSNVNVNNITVIDYEKNIGSGTGHFIVGGQSDNVNITNSYFYTKDNGQHSTVVFSGCSNILFENNTIIGEGAIGNLLYLNTFNVDLDENSISHSNFIIRNNLINASRAPSQMTCFAICLTGSNILIDNNTVDYNGTNICPIFGGQGVLDNITIQNNNLRSVLLGSAGIIEVKYINNTKIINNTIDGLIISKSYESTHKSEMYNNTIEALRLEADDCIVEGNTLKQINNTGNNNIINNNTISTMNKYTIITTGENTTITNNKLASKDYYGDESINGLTTILENNTSTNRIITITDSNWESYLTKSSTNDYTFNNNINNSIINMDLSLIIDHLKLNNYMNVTFNKLSTPIINKITVGNSNLTFNNIYLPDVFYSGGMKNNVIMNNTTFLAVVSAPANFYNITQINSTQINNTNNTYVLAYTLSQGNPKMSNEKLYNQIYDQNTNKLLSTVPSNANVIIRNTRNSNYNYPMIIDRPVNITSYNSAIWNGDITFLSGSEGSNISGLIINATLNIQTNNINVFNNTIKKIVMDNCIACNIHNNTFNTTETAMKLNSVFNSNITDNIIDITGENTISLDSDSSGNIIKNNLLIAGNKYNINSISGNLNENTIVDNTPMLNTSISIELQDSTLINIKIPINVTVNTDTGVVDNGYVVILVNGVEQTNETLTNGRLETTITPTQKGVNTVKAWYFPTNLYNINSQTKELNVNSIKTTLKITDVTTAKVGENITITTTIKDQSNNNINEGEIIYTIGNDTFTSQIVNGISTINITTKEEYKNAELIAYYPGENSYDESTNKTTLSLNPGEAILTITKEDNQDKITLTITVTDINNNKVKNGYIQFKEDLTDLVELQNGTLTYNITKSTTDMTINVTFRLNPAFETKTEQITIKAPIMTITTLKDIIGLINTPTTITATITDKNGTNINSGTVTFTDNEDNILAEIQVRDGTATTTITSSKEINTTLTATYTPETNDYLPSNTTATLLIQKPESHANITTEYVILGETTTLTAAFYDENGNPVNGGKTIFKVNGKTLRDNDGNVIYAEIIDGQATLPNVNITKEWLKPDTTIQAIYTGDNNEAIITKPTTINVTRPEATITLEAPATATIGETITLTANVTDGDKLVNSGRVVFKLNGKTLKDDDGKALYVNVENGVATTTYTIPAKTKAKTYNLTVVFTDTQYDRKEASTELNIAKA